MKLIIDCELRGKTVLALNYGQVDYKAIVKDIALSKNSIVLSLSPPALRPPFALFPQPLSPQI